VDEGALGCIIYSFSPLLDQFPAVVQPFAQVLGGVQLEVAQSTLFLVTRHGAVWSLSLYLPSASSASSHFGTSSVPAKLLPVVPANATIQRIRAELRPTRIFASSHHFACLNHAPLPPNPKAIPLTPR